MEEEYTILATDKSRPRKFLYHKDKKPMIVYEEDANQHYADGWQDSPAAFFNMAAHGVPKEDMPQIHEQIEEINDLANGDINLDAMDTKELRAYAEKHYPGLEFHKNAKRVTMIKKIREAQKSVDEFVNGDPETVHNDNSIEDNNESVPESDDQSS